jgi:hypothetical protein
MICPVKVRSAPKAVVPQTLPIFQSRRFALCWQLISKTVGATLSSTRLLRRHEHADP